MTLAPAPPRASFNYRELGREARERIHAMGMGYRAAAVEIGITPTDLTRLDSGQALAFHKVVAVCDWLRVDLRQHYAAPPVDQAKSTCCSGLPVKHGGQS